MGRDWLMRPATDGDTKPQITEEDHRSSTVWMLHHPDSAAC